MSDNFVEFYEDNPVNFLSLDPIAILPLRGMVIFPKTTIHLDVGRPKSIESLNIGMNNQKKIFLVAQKDTMIEDPTINDLYKIGVFAEIKQIMKLPTGIVRVLIETSARGELKKIYQSKTHFEGKVVLLDDPLNDQGLEIKALNRLILHDFSDFSDMNVNFSNENILKIKNINNPNTIADLIVSNLMVDYTEKQKVLEMNDLKEKLETVLSMISVEKNLIELEKEIGEKVKESIDKAQKEYYLREQIKVIKKELNEKVDYEEEIDKLRERLTQGDYPESVYDKIKKEIDRLEIMHPNMTEGAVIRNYIEWLLDLPWNKRTDEYIDIEKVKKVLDDGHFGLQEVKDRIIEYLAVKKLIKGKGKAPILCFVGPPGTGKTSLASSIGDAINRKFIRMSLGGVRDEAEIRGHRRTYVGALPGRIIQSMKLAGTKNPIILLDEIDKIGADYKGDPSAALLEALDPEQNNSFTDHFIEIPFDLSEVLFITTANTLNTIPAPLRDRMEIIKVSSYTEKEKKEIAKRHLFKKQIAANGLEDYQIKIQDTALMKIIRNYTRESGVRNLEREIGSLLRKIAVDILSNKFISINITSKDVSHYLGIPKVNDYVAKRKTDIGVVNGLAVTSFGGDVLIIEATIYKGKGKLMLTGQLGDVMKESVQAAISYLKSKNIIQSSLEELELDLHIHVPEGAIPKDGPSAGIAMGTVIASIFLKKKIRKDIAMTGEITIRGNVLPIGGVKEKVLAAFKEGIKTVILPKANEKNIEEIPIEVREKIEIILVESFDEVLEKALV
ncbi:MAG: endopeptidase La [Firmicutes bacterium]|nr:endopeptidase La [Bacillota bacterium]